MPSTDFPHGINLNPDKTKAPLRKGYRISYQFEGPWNVGDPVHEAITLEALKKAEIIESHKSIKDSRVWEFIRGVIWNDDPEGMLFDNNKSETDNWSDGIKFLLQFNASKKSARDGTFFGPGTSLLARSHFGDLQCLHAMASRDGEAPESTRQFILEWAELLYLIALGRIKKDAPIGEVASRWFPRVRKSVNALFLIGQRGNIRQRAMGSLLHMVQDSYASGHVQRNKKWEISEFHSYVNQNSEIHKRGDVMAKGGLSKMPGAQQAIVACSQVLTHWKKSHAWSTLKPFLEDTVFKLSLNAKSAGPGH